jgi:hypothetical protein
MPTFLDDTFTEGSTINLSAHTPEVGGAWTALGGTMNVSGGNGYCLGSSASSSASYNNGATPPSADYYVEIQISRVFAPGNSILTGMRGRYVDGSNFYEAYYNQAATRWEMYCAATLLGTYSVALSAVEASPDTVKLEMIGTSIKLYINGVQRISVTNATVSAAGSVGVRGRSEGYIHRITAATIGGSTALPKIMQLLN